MDRGVPFCSKPGSSPGARGLQPPSAQWDTFFWKLDFDLAGSRRNDFVEELNFTQSDGRTIREMKRYSQETASDVNPQTLRRWRVVDGTTTNNKGKPISYEKAIKLIEDNNYQVQVLDHESDTPTVKISTEPFTINKGSKSNILPPPPPAPEDPMEYIKKMEDQGATFIYEGKEVTYNYVIDVVLFRKNLNIQTKTSNDGPPIVYLSREFIHMKGDN